MTRGSSRTRCAQLFSGAERRIAKSCGTPPYVSPEVISKKPYRAEPADIWSCAIVLVAMLAGKVGLTFYFAVLNALHGHRSLELNGRCV